MSKVWDDIFLDWKKKHQLKIEGYSCGLNEYDPNLSLVGTYSLLQCRPKSMGPISPLEKTHAYWCALYVMVFLFGTKK